MALQLAENPQTGERIALVNGRWVPFTQIAQNPQTGERAILVNGLWYTDSLGAAPQAEKPEPKPQKPQEESGFFRQTLDVPVQVASGLATGVRLVTDAFGADNPVSQNIRGVEDYLQSLLSAQAKNDQQEIARIMKAAEDQGVGANLRAALEAFATAPVDLIAQAAGTAVPTIAGGLAAQALKAPALLASTGVGAVMGAGTIKSSIYDQVKQTLTELGASPEEAEKRAVLAQEYGGENLDQILLGTVIGGAAGRFGIESNVAKQLAENIAAKSIGKAALQEAAPEAVQAAQEQIAQNVALQREGIPTPTFRGAVGAGALEAIAGGALGAGIEAARPEVPPVQEVTTEEPPPPPPAAPPDEERAKLLADIEEVTEPADEEEKKKFEATVKKITEGEMGTALNIARTRVQETGKTAAPYIMNAVNANLPEGMARITMSQASQIRSQLVDEGVIIGKDKVSKVEPAAVEPAKPKDAFRIVNGEIIEPEFDEDEVVSYDDLERRQDEAAAKAVETEAKDVSATDAQITEKVKPTGRRERVSVPVSGKPTATAADTTPGTLNGGVGNVTNTTKRTVTGKGLSAPPLEEQVAETPQERYESLVRRLEGLQTTRRIQPVVANRVRTQLRQGNPQTNPNTYEPILKQADEILSRYEETAEKVESDASIRGVDQRERALRQQESVALDRAQRNIEQEKIADSLRETSDRRLSESELMSDHTRSIRDALEVNDLKTVTQKLVDARTATDVYPKAAAKFRPIFTAVARKLNSVDFSNVKVQTEATPNANLEIFKRLKQEQKLAEYDPANNTLYIRRDKVQGNVVTHELIHAGTVQTIRQYELDKSKLTEEQRLGVERLMNVFAVAQEQTVDLSLVREYPAAFENIYEFIAVGLTSPTFQARLARVEVTTPIGRKNMWTEFVNAVANLFGVKFKREDSVSALDEVGQAFSEILAAPVEGGITGISPLAAKKADKAPKGKIDPFEEVEKKYDAVNADKLKLSGLIKHLTSTESVEESIRLLQDEQRPLLTLQREMDRAKVAIWTSGKTGGNTLASANDESRGRYENYEKVVTPLFINLNKAVEAYKAKSGRTLKKAMRQLDTFFIAETSDQRRLTNYLKEKPLKTTPTIRLKGSDKLISYAQLRDMLIDSVQTTQELDDATRNAIYNRLLQLAGVEIGADGKVRKAADADKYADPLGASYGQVDRKGEARKPSKRDVNYEDPYYDIIEDWDFKTNNEVLRQMAEEMKVYGNEIKAVREALIALDKVTMQFNAEANHLTQPAKNLIKLYGWDKYVPLMGKMKPEIAKKDQFVYINTVPNEFIPGFRGRADAPDSPILMTQINAGKAATRAARSDIVPTLVNLLKPHPRTGQSYVKGGTEPIGVIKFTDRYKGEINFQEKNKDGSDKWVGKDKFYNYLPNGDIEVWKVDDPKIVEALRPKWEPTKGVLGRLESGSRWITNLIGQGHTRYQIKFAIYDFPRNVIANSGVIMSELGPVEGAKYFAGVGREIFQKIRIPQVWRIAAAHYDGDWNKIKQIGGYNEKTGKWRDQFVGDTYDYLQRGGRVSIVKSWQTRGQLEKMVTEINKADWRRNTEEALSKSKDFLDRYFDLWMDGFELVARVQAYKTAKSQGMNVRGMSEAEAEQYGVYFSKNLANFEKKGLNKAPSALYAFFSPSATGAVRALEAIAPAFRIRFNGNNVKKIIQELPEEIRQDPEAVANYEASYLQQARNAQMTMAFFASFGAMTAYMALSLGGSGDDEDNPTNLVGADNKELWTRNMRFPLDWLDIPSLKDKFAQIPWGFGMGAFAAAGAQTTFLVNNGVTNMSTKEYVGNMISIGLDSYVPLPFARFNPLDNPFIWTVNSLAPAPIRPLFEYAFNTSSLGQSIYRDYYNRYGPAYGGSENIEEAYRYAAQAISSMSLGRYQPEPKEVRFFATGYLDGPASILADAVNINLVLNSAKDFDPKTDTVFLDSYIGTKIEPVLIKFNKANTRLEVLKRGYDTAMNSPNPELRTRFLREYPNAPAIITVYNKQVATLNRASQISAAPQVFADSIQERKKLNKTFNGIKNIHMNQIVKWYETYQDDIDDYYGDYNPLTD
jgi:dUTPase